MHTELIQYVRVRVELKQVSSKLQGVTPQHSAFDPMGIEYCLNNAIDDLCDHLGCDIPLFLHDQNPSIF